MKPQFTASEVNNYGTLHPEAAQRSCQPYPGRRAWGSQLSLPLARLDGDKGQTLVPAHCASIRNSVGNKIEVASTLYYAEMAVDAEEVQELGREGVASVKRWLEATTFLELNWNVYENAPMCVMPCLGGERKKFDLAGAFLGNHRHPVVVECKNYSTPGAQHKYYKEFLAIAYSSTIREMEERGDTGREFIWVTTHPFQLTDWKILETEEKIRQALADNPKFLAGREIDEKVLREVADRIWVLVMNRKQENISLTNEELMIVLAKLERKAPTL